MNNHQFLEFLKLFFINFFVTLAQMSPFLILGFFVSGILSFFLKPGFIKSKMGKKGFFSVLKSVLIGVPMPLCSCGVLPVAISLKESGASRGAAAGFLIATPQTGVDSIAVTYSFMGPFIALFRPLAAFVSGIIGGVLTDLIPEKSSQSSESSESGCSSCCSSQAKIKSVSPEHALQSSCCSAEKHKEESGFKKAMYYAFVKLPSSLLYPVGWGVFFAALISTLLPQNGLAGLSSMGIYTKVLILFISIPFYICATSSVPVAASLMAAGMSPGTAFVFLMGGPATNAATLAAVWKKIGPRAAMVFLFTISGSALFFGELMDYLVIYYSISLKPFFQNSAMGSKHASIAIWAGLLIAIFIFARIAENKKQAQPS